MAPYYFMLTEYLAIVEVLRDFPNGLSAPEAIERTPFKIPRWICAEMYGHGWLCRSGSGTKGDPYVYSLGKNGALLGKRLEFLRKESVLA